MITSTRFRAIACVALAIISTTPIVDGENPRAVAVICRVEGAVTVKPPGSEPRRARLLGRIEPRTSITVPESARLEIVYFDGSRVRVTGVATAVVGEGNLVDVEGKLEHLGQVATKPALAPLAEVDAIGPDTAVTVIRGGNGRAGEFELEPAQGGATLADATVLRFTPIRGAEHYQVYVEHHPTLDRVFSTETGSTEIALPPDALEPGQEYYWSVRTLPPRRPTVRGGAVFHTVSGDAATHRASLAEAAAQDGDPALWVLLAGLDLALGLDRLACEDLARVSSSLAVVELTSSLQCRHP